MYLKMNNPLQAGKNSVFNDLGVELEPGFHAVSLPLTGLTNAGDAPHPVRVCFTYNYHEANGLIELCDSSYTGPEGLSLVLHGQNGAAGISRACDYDPAKNSGLALARQAWEMNESLLAHAQTLGLVLLRRLDPPALSAEMERKLQLVYRNGLFDSLYDEALDYGPDCELVPFTSIPAGKFDIEPYKEYYNVNGSTNDTKYKGKHWIDLWADYTHGEKDFCASAGSAGVPCTANLTNNLVGGHLVFDPNKVNVSGTEELVNRIVFILPICKAHNSRFVTQAQHSEIEKLEGLWLNRYEGYPTEALHTIKEQGENRHGR